MNLRLYQSYCTFKTMKTAIYGLISWIIKFECVFYVTEYVWRYYWTALYLLNFINKLFFCKNVSWGNQKIFLFFFLTDCLFVLYAIIDAKGIEVNLYLVEIFVRHTEFSVSFFITIWLICSKKNIYLFLPWDNLKVSEILID